MVEPPKIYLKTKPLKSLLELQKLSPEYQHLAIKDIAEIELEARCLERIKIIKEKAIKENPIEIPAHYEEDEEETSDENNNGLSGLRTPDHQILSSIDNLGKNGYKFIGKCFDAEVTLFINPDKYFQKGAKTMRESIKKRGGFNTLKEVVHRGTNYNKHKTGRQSNHQENVSIPGSYGKRTKNTI